MSEDLMKLLAEQIALQKQQLEQQAAQHKEDIKMQREQTEKMLSVQKEQLDLQTKQMMIQREEHKEEMEKQQEQIAGLLQMVHGQAKDGNSSQVTSTVQTSIPPFSPFDSTTELWPDYWARFCTFSAANAVPENRQAQVFLTNQSSAIYKQLSNLAAQETPPKDINKLSMQEITDYMKEQFDPKRFIIRERFKFWSDMKRKPGETLQELAARIRQDAATCDFSSIKDPQDEALRQRFICSVNNEAVLKALFKMKDQDLDFAKAIQVAIETEDAAKVAKETVYGFKNIPVHKIWHNKNPI